MSADLDCGSKSRLQGRYANYFEVGLNRDEVVIDLGQAYGGRDSVSLHTRIITSPAYARDLASLLEESLREFERSRENPDREEESQGGK